MKSFLWSVAGALMGLFGGLVLAAVFGDAITLAWKISRFEGGQGYFVVFVLMPIFGLIGLILGAIMIFQGWRFNLSVVALLVLSGVGFVYYYRAAFFEPIPQVEQVENFTLLTYANEYTEWHNVVYGVHYHGEPIQIEGNTTQRFNAITTVALPSPKRASALIMNADVAEESRFYLVYEEAGQAKTLPLCASARLAPVDWLDQPVGDAEYRSRDWYTQRQSLTGGRWLLLGDDCVLDLQTLTLYPVDLPSPHGDADALTLDGAHLPVALSPDQQSFVRVGWLDVHTPAYTSLGEVLHLIVYNFVENVTYTVPVNRQQMRYSRLPGGPDQPDDINAAWLDHHFQWQRTAAGYDRLVARPAFTPWPLRGWRFGTGADMNYRLEPVKAEMFDKLAEFLEQEFQAQRLTTDPSDESGDESGSIYTTIDFQLGEQQVAISYSRDEYSTPHLSLWQSSSTLDGKLPDDTLIEEISRRFDDLLKTGDYDAFFDEQFLRDPVVE
jgi:hypothetical protein